MQVRRFAIAAAGDAGERFSCVLGARRAWRAAGFQFAGECPGAGAADREAAGTGHGTSRELGSREPLAAGEYGLDGGNG